MTLIKDFIFNKEGENPIVKIVDDDVVLIQTRCYANKTGPEKMKRAYSNTIGIGPYEIYVNPVLDIYRNNYTEELRNFLLTLPNIILEINREEKLSQILIK